MKFHIGTSNAQRLFVRYSPPARIAAVLAVFAISACGGDSTGPEQHSNSSAPGRIVALSGTGQTVRIGSVVPTPIVFRVTDGNGAPVSNVSVQFAVSAGGGSLSSTSGVTDTNGSVTAPQWTTGATTGTYTLTASASGLAPASVSVTARYPHWTLMVYMAADNNLSIEGAINLIQMAAAGVNPEVQVVVQGEFSPTEWARWGCGASCTDRPNFDTFRYQMDGSSPLSPHGIFNGRVTDVGNLDMTNPATLHSFVQWADSVAPAEHTALTLWNHGGDSGGLIVDQTSAGDVPMSLTQLHAALSGLPVFDIVDFEMCLMAGYEPLTMMNGLTQTVIASEEEAIVSGWDFGQLLNAMYQEPTADAPKMAVRLAGAYNAGYADQLYSTTVSAFEMDGFNAFDGAVSGLAQALSSTPSTNVGVITSASSNSQRYGYPWVVDLGDLADSLAADVPDPTVAAAAGTLKAAVAAPGFLLANYVSNGSVHGQPDVSRSHGVQIVMPVPGAPLPDQGPFSLASYQQAFAPAAWTTFLENWVPLTSALRTFVDLGTNTMTLWEVWDSTFVPRGQIEMLLVEPDGKLYGPVYGSVSPSGVFSADAAAVSTYWEGWASDRYVESGTFYWLAWLASDSTDFQPLVNVGYQIGAGTVTSLYGPGTYPQLSLATSFLADPNFSWSRLQAGDYTDLKIVATWTTGPAGAPQLVAGPSAVSASVLPSVTAQQVQALRQFARDAVQARTAPHTNASWRRAAAPALPLRIRGGVRR